MTDITKKDDVMGAYSNVPVIQREHPMDIVPAQPLGRASQNPDNPNEWTFTFPEHSKFLQWLKHGQLKEIYLDALITGVDPEFVKSLGEKN